MITKDMILKEWRAEIPFRSPWISRAKILSHSASFLRDPVHKN
jgi:hypothetical protein